MANKPLSQAELQTIEHSNKVLEEHLELVSRVTNETEALLNNYVPILRGYIDGVIAIRTELGKEVVHIIQSSREIGGVAKNTNEILGFINAVVKLDQMLTPELVEKLNKVIK